MFTMEVQGLGHLRSLLLPLTSVRSSGDIEFSPESVSLTVTRQAYRSFTVVLHLSDLFFFSFVGNGYRRSRIDLHRLLLPVDNLAADDLFLAINIPEAHTVANLVYSNRTRAYQNFTQFTVFPSQNEELEEINYGMFVAIEAIQFRDLVLNFGGCNTTIWVEASRLQVMFSDVHREMVLRPVVMSGVDAMEFPIFLDPVTFFLQTSFLTDLVWFFWTIDQSIVMKFTTGRWSHVLVHYPRHDIILDEAM